MLGLFDGGEHDAAPANDLRVLTLVERGVKEAQSLASDPAIQAELRETLGSLYQRLGKFDEAEGLLRTALEQRQALHGASHQDVADSLLSLGLLKVDQAKFDDAERLIREGLEMDRRVLPARHPRLAKATAALGKVLEERGDYPRAIDALEEAVALYGPAVSSPTPDVAATMSELANAHLSSDLRRQALPRGRGSVESRQRVSGTWRQW